MHGGITIYLYNAANEMVLITPTGAPPATLSYDLNGNLSVENAGGALPSYAWDPENRLTGVAYPDGTRETYLYSADGMRQKKVTSAGAVNFVWDEVNVLLETDGGGVTQGHYTDFPGYWGGLVSERRGAASSFYGFDLQGSSRILASLAGAVTDAYGYKAFGEELSVSGTTVNPFRYVGQFRYYRDMGTRLSVGARYLDEPWSQMVAT